MPIGALSIKITGDISDFNKSIASVQKTLNTQTKGLQTVARNMTTVGDSMVKGITLPILAVGAGLLKLGEDFDAAYDKIRVGTGKTGKELEALNDDFRAVAKVAPSAFADIGTAIAGYSSKLGLAGKPLQDLSTQILNLSRLTKTDLNTNIDQSAKLFNNWKIATADQSKTLDLMFRASQITGIEIGKLMSEVASSGPILRTMGYDLETSTALIAGFDKAGVDVSSTIAGMKKALVTMAKEGMGDPQEVLAMYIDKIKGAKTEVEAIGIAAELFGARGGAQMAIAIREGRLNLDDLVASLKDAEGGISAASQATLDWQEKLILLKNNLALALEPLATKVFESLGKMIGDVTPKIEELAKKFGELSPKMQDSLLQWAGMIAIGGPLVSFLGRAATGVIGLYKAIGLLNVAGKGSMLLKIAQYAPELALALGLIELQVNSSAEAFKNFELVQTKLRSPMYLVGTAADDVRRNMSALQEEMKVVSKEGADYLMLKMIELSNQFLEGKITAEDLAYGLGLLNTSIIPTTTATEDLTNATTEQIVAATDHKNAIANLAAIYPDLTDAQLEEKLAMDEGTDSTEDQTQAVDKLRSVFNKLIDEIFGGITTYNDFEESNWAVEAAQKALAEAIKKYGEGSREAMQAQNDLDDANITAIETAFELSTAIGATSEQQVEARNKAIELGLEYVNTGQMGIDKFIELAASFGLSSADIVAYADAMDIKLNTATRKRLLEIDTQPAKKEIQDYLDFIGASNFNISSKVTVLHEDLWATGKYEKGGPVGFSGGGFLDKILSASAGIKLPKFDNGGVLAVLHPPEVVLNAKEAMQLVWNMANKPMDANNKGGINNTYNITSPKPLTESEIKRQIDLYSRELGYKMGLN